MKQKKNGMNVFPLLFIALSLTLAGCADTNSSATDGSSSSESSNNGNSENSSSSASSEGSIYYRVEFDSDGASFVNDQLVEEGDKVSNPLVYLLGHTLKGWYLGEEKWDFASDIVVENITLKARWEEDEIPVTDNLPIIDIDLKGELLVNVNREDYVDSIISLSNSGTDEDIDKVKAEFRGRGHGSWSYEKKGYRIKFDKKQALFGLPKSKHWVLVAGAHDQSMIRNNLAYTITNDVLDNIEYQTAVHEVNVFVNGDYRGVYSLFEQIRVDEDRVNIESLFGEVDTGYLIEYNAYAPEGGAIEGINYFRIEGLKYPFEVKSPDPDDYIEEGLTKEGYQAQVTFIKSYVQRVVDAILAQDFATFSELVDVPSFVDVYLIHELFKNTDTGWSSLYFYKKPSGKLYAGPVWDFDYSSGISRGDSRAAGIYVGDGAAKDSPDTANELFISLMKQNEFVNLVKERFNAKKDEILTSISNYELKIKDFEESYLLDAQRWSNGYPSWFIEQRKVFKWLGDRIAWLALWAKAA